MGDEQMTLAQAAERFNVPKRTLQYAIKHRTLKAERLGSIWVTTAAEVGNWIAHGPHRPGRPAKDAKRQERHAHGDSDGE
jgi:excisionase family DNA binding protein